MLVKLTFGIIKVMMIVIIPKQKECLLMNYIIKLGFLDGRAGYVYASLKKQYIFNIKAKIDELRTR